MEKPFTVKDQATIESLQAELAATRLELLRTIHRAEMAEKGEWISCEERLPKKNKWILVFRGNKRTAYGPAKRMNMCYWDGEYFKSGGHWLEGVTYWAELPPPPKEG